MNRKIAAVKRRLRNVIDTIPTGYWYTRADSKYRTFKRTPGAPCAVVVHLFYPDMWPGFLKRLQAMDEIKFDLFVTLPKHEEAFADQITKDFPGSVVYVARNRGRDVLPFLRVMRIIRREGYTYLLKMHSKKSPQREDGDQWSNELLSTLVANDKDLQKRLHKILMDERTGIIGPIGNYVPLPTYYNDNHHLIMFGLTEIYGREVALKVERDKWEYGFFAGTMFWARVDALAPVVDKNLPIRYFRPEGKQLDGTIAHALERIFSVGCEVEGRKMYELSQQTVKEIPYKSNLIPEWSDLHENHTAQAAQ